MAQDMTPKLGFGATLVGALAIRVRAASIARSAVMVAWPRIQLEG